MSTTLTVHCRASTPLSACQEDVVATARALAATGRVDHVESNEWPATATRSHDCEPVRVYERVRDWADANDVDVTPPFRVHTRTSHAATPEEILHTPLVYCTLERDGELVGAAPCTLPDATHLTARAFLDSIQDQRNPFERAETDAVTA